VWTVARAQEFMMTVTVVRLDPARTPHEVRIGDHRLITDMTPAEGGEDAGPGPHALYDSALGACKALTLVWYATRKKLPLETLEVRVERDDSQERRGTYRLDVAIWLGGPLSEAQRQELLAVADKCPVHRLMTEATTVISTRLAE
jgi:putative redox protein